MQTGGKNSQQTVVCSVHKEPQRERVSRVFLAQIRSVRAQLPGVHERSKVEMPRRIHKMRKLGRQVHMVAVLFCRVVRREKTSADNKPVESEENDKPSC